MIAESKVQYTSNNALVGGDWNMVQDEWKYRSPIYGLDGKII